MNKCLGVKILCLCIFCVMSLYGVGIDVNPDKRGWHIELKRIAANVSSTSIQGQTEYESFSDSRISGDSQLIGQGYFDLGVDFMHHVM